MRYSIPLGLALLLGVVSGGWADTLYRIDGQTFEGKLISQDDKTQITKGLQAGEQVISSGAYAMDDGTKVKVGAADDKGADEAKPSAAKDGGKD